MENEKAYVISDCDGTFIIKFPDFIAKKFHMKQGDYVNVDISNNEIIITPEKKVDIDIDIDDDVLFKIMLEAHKRDMTLNQLVTDILKNEIANKKKKIENNDNY